MKCGSCRTSKAEKYVKVDTGRLFEILKNLNSRRAYDPNRQYFCGKCIAKAKKEEDYNDDVSDQDANSLTLTTGERSESSTVSSKDEYDLIVEARRYFTCKGAPIRPVKRSRPPLTGPKPCPKRYKPAKTQGSMTQNSGDQNAAPPGVPREETPPKQGHDTPILAILRYTPSSAHQSPNEGGTESQSGSITEQRPPVVKSKTRWQPPRRPLESSPESHRLTSSNGSKSKKSRPTSGGEAERNPRPSTTSGSNRTDQRPGTTSGRMEPQFSTRRFDDGGGDSD